MKNKATNRIVSLILALMLIVGQASVVIAADEPVVDVTEIFEEVMPNLSNLEQPVAPPAVLDMDAIPEVELVSDGNTQTVITASEESLQAGLAKGSAPTAFNGYAASFSQVGDQERFYGGDDVTRQTLKSFTLIGIADDCEVYLENSLPSNVFQAFKDDGQDIADEFQNIIDMLTDPSSDLYISTLWNFSGIIDEEPSKLLLYDMPADPSSNLITGGFYNPNEYTGFYSSPNNNYNGNDGIFIHLNAGYNWAGYLLYNDSPTEWFGTVAHEYQHLLTFDEYYKPYYQSGGMVSYKNGSSDQDYGWGQPATWLNEGRSGLVDRAYAGVMGDDHLQFFLEPFNNSILTYVPNSTQWSNANSSLRVLSYYGSTSLLLQDYYQYSAYGNLSNASTNGLSATLSGNRIGYGHTLDYVGDNFNVANGVNSGGTSFDDFFLLANLDIAVDNSSADYSVISNDPAYNAYTHMVLGADSLWDYRYWMTNDTYFAGVTDIAPNQSIPVSSGGTSYYANLYLAESVGNGKDTAIINVPSSTRAKYYVITPYNNTQVDNDVDWINTGKIAAELTPGENTVTVGSNNMFAVLVVNFSSSVNESFSYEATRIGGALDVVSVTTSGTLVSGQTGSITVVVEDAESIVSSYATKMVLTDDTSTQANGFTITNGGFNGTPKRATIGITANNTVKAGSYSLEITATLVDGSEEVTLTSGVVFTVVGKMDSPAAGALVDPVEVASVKVSFDGPVTTAAGGKISLGSSGGSGDIYTATLAASETLSNSVTVPISYFKDSSGDNIIVAFDDEYEVTVEANAVVDAYGAGNTQQVLGSFQTDSLGDEPVVIPAVLDLEKDDSGVFAVYFGVDNNIVSAEIVDYDDSMVDVSVETVDDGDRIVVIGKKVGSTTITVAFTDVDDDTVEKEIAVNITGTPDPITRPSGGGSGGGSDKSPAAYSQDRVTASSSGAGSSVVAPVADGILWIDAAGAQTYLDTANSEDLAHVRIRHTGAFGLRQAALLLLDGFRGEFDSVADGAVQVRVTLLAPETAEKDLLVSGSIKGAQVDKVKATFQRWFNNDLQVIHLDQSGEWGQVATIAALVDLSGMDTDNLAFYSYDSESYLYKRIQNVSYRIDANGYLVFTTDLAGDIVVSSGSFTKDAAQEAAEESVEEPDTAVNTETSATSTPAVETTAAEEDKDETTEG